MMRSTFWRQLWPWPPARFSARIRFVATRRGRDGRGLSRPRHAARSRRRHQGAGRLAGDRPPGATGSNVRRARSLAEPSSHLRGPRCRPARRDATTWSWSYLDGETLAQRLANGAAAARPKAPSRRADRRRARQGAPQGIVHRDLKPANIMLTKDRRQASRLRSGQAAGHPGRCRGEEPPTTSLP